MDGKSNLPIKSDSSSPPDFLRHVQAALKRHRPLGTGQSNIIRPRRTILRQPTHDLISNTNIDSPETSTVIAPSQYANVPNKVPQGASDEKAIELENLSSYMSSLGFTEMEYIEGNRAEASIGLQDDLKQPKIQQVEPDFSLRSDGGMSCSMLPRRATVTRDDLQQFRNFLSQPATQSSVVGPSCATTTSVHSTSAPMMNSTTRLHLDSGSRVGAEPLGEIGVYPIAERVMESENTEASGEKDNKMSVDKAATAVQASDSCVGAELASKESDQSKKHQECMLKETGNLKYASSDVDKLTDGKEPVDVAHVRCQAPVPKTSFLDVKSEYSKLEKPEKAASSKGSSVSKKRSYDPDLFFKVNGKLYQRLGKIGSGGSSEVHKVISSDCRIYALKKIKLRGRDYATAFGFCQEIEYLNRLRGKDNIIQLIDYEVTDKALLEQVMKGSLSNKDGRVKDDGYIYMVLEYGEIDLAHMLSQKWKELDGSNETINENWLRFYWQTVLLTPFAANSSSCQYYSRGTYCAL
ncbi:Serine/Threonine kinase family protein [Medicago truncatula]|uniref:Serine/Threonine kinase family protein n=1 Tax=Medicago truncatula TaxID=3880 RepID=A0A072UZL2_MEDTR|nr:Serine/Threonine kinase family protein [Medicago truncatula]